MVIPLDELITIRDKRLESVLTPPIDNPVEKVATLKATGQNNLFWLQWSPVPDADGYRIAAMNNKNLAAPNEGIYVVWHPQVTYQYPVSDNGLVRNFAVQAFIGSFVGPWSDIVSATSTAGAASPPSSPAPAVPSGADDDLGLPAGDEPIPRHPNVPEIPL